LLLAGRALGHGKISSPPARSATIGSAFEDACGSTLYSLETSDPTGNIQQMLQNIQSGTTLNSSCDLFQCKAYQFADNKANVQSYTAGQVIPIKIDIVAPHTGVANVSVVDTASNSILGGELISFTNYASTSTGVAPNNTAFSVTMPDVSDTCTTAGACVLQWYWFSEEVDQTYEDCIDFTMGSGSSSDSSDAASSAVASATESAAA
ncbi:hypothetical protein FISHEDRAFT_9647, partial [Fistulina hepatica ATCC 64428]